MSIFKPSASIYKNKRIISVVCCSGYRRTMHDPQQYLHHLPLNCSDASLGESVSEALSKSRLVTSKDDPDFYDFRNTTHYDYWLINFINSSGYKTKTSAFNDIKSCTVTKYNDSIVIKPMKKLRGDAWEGFVGRKCAICNSFFKRFRTNW